MARERHDPDRCEHARQRQENRDSDRDQAAQHEQQDNDRDRDRPLTGQLELVQEHLVERLVGAYSRVAHVEPRMSLRDLLRRRRHRVDVLLGLVGVAPHFPLDDRRVPVVADQGLVAAPVGRVEALDRRVRLDRTDDVADGGPKGRAVDRLPLALDQHELGLRSPLREGFLQDLIGSVRLSDAGVVLVDLLQADDLSTEAEENDDAGEPAEDGRFPVGRAPRAHPACDVHRPLHLSGRQVDRRLAAGRLRLVLDHTRFHLGSSRSPWVSSTSHRRRARESRKTCRLQGRVSGVLLRTEKSEDGEHAA